MLKNHAFFGRPASSYVMWLCLLVTFATPLNLSLGAISGAQMCVFLPLPRCVRVNGANDGELQIVQLTRQRGTMTIETFGAQSAASRLVAALFADCIVSKCLPTDRVGNHLYCVASPFSRGLVRYLHLRLRNDRAKLWFGCG